MVLFQVSSLVIVMSMVTNTGAAVLKEEYLLPGPTQTEAPSTYEISGIDESSLSSLEPPTTTQLFQQNPNPFPTNPPQPNPNMDTFPTSISSFPSITNFKPFGSKPKTPTTSSTASQSTAPPTYPTTRPPLFSARPPFQTERPTAAPSTKTTPSPLPLTSPSLTDLNVDLSVSLPQEIPEPPPPTGCCCQTGGNGLQQNQPTIIMMPMPISFKIKGIKKVFNREEDEGINRQEVEIEEDEIDVVPDEGQIVGQYSFKRPDGVLMTVKYKSDEDNYQATVIENSNEPADFQSEIDSGIHTKVQNPGKIIHEVHFQQVPKQPPPLSNIEPSNQNLFDNQLSNQHLVLTEQKYQVNIENSNFHSEGSNLGDSKFSVFQNIPLKVNIPESETSNESSLEVIPEQSHLQPLLSDSQGQQQTHTPIVSETLSGNQDPNVFHQLQAHIQQPIFSNQGQQQSQFQIATETVSDNQGINNVSEQLETSFQQPIFNSQEQQPQQIHVATETLSGNQEIDVSQPFEIHLQVPLSDSKGHQLTQNQEAKETISGNQEINSSSGNEEIDISQQLEANFQPLLSDSQGQQQTHTSIASEKLSGNQDLNVFHQLQAHIQQPIFSNQGQQQSQFQIATDTVSDNQGIINVSEQLETSFQQPIFNSQEQQPQQIHVATEKLSGNQEIDVSQQFEIHLQVPVSDSEGHQLTQNQEAKETISGNQEINDNAPQQLAGNFQQSSSDSQGQQQTHNRVAVETLTSTQEIEDITQELDGHFEQKPFEGHFQQHPFSNSQGQQQTHNQVAVETLTSTQEIEDVTHQLQGHFQQQSFSNSQGQHQAQNQVAKETLSGPQEINIVDQQLEGPFQQSFSGDQGQQQTLNQEVTDTLSGTQDIDDINQQFEGHFQQSISDDQGQQQALNQVATETLFGTQEHPQTHFQQTTDSLTPNSSKSPFSPTTSLVQNTEKILDSTQTDSQNTEPEFHSFSNIATETFLPQEVNTHLQLQISNTDVLESSHLQLTGPSLKPQSPASIFSPQIATLQDPSQIGSEESISAGQTEIADNSQVQENDRLSQFQSSSNQGTANIFEVNNLFQASNINNDGVTQAEINESEDSSTPQSHISLFSTTPFTQEISLKGQDSLHTNSQKILTDTQSETLTNNKVNVGISQPQSSNNLEFKPDGNHSLQTSLNAEVIQQNQNPEPTIATQSPISVFSTAITGLKNPSNLEDSQQSDSQASQNLKPEGISFESHFSEPEAPTLFKPFEIKQTSNIDGLQQSNFQTSEPSAIPQSPASIFSKLENPTLQYSKITSLPEKDTPSHFQSDGQQETGFLHQQGNQLQQALSDIEGQQQTDLHISEHLLTPQLVGTVQTSEISRPQNPFTSQDSKVIIDQQSQNTEPSEALAGNPPKYEGPYLFKFSDSNIGNLQQNDHQSDNLFTVQSTTSLFSPTSTIEENPSQPQYSSQNNFHQSESETESEEIPIIETDDPSQFQSSTEIGADYFDFQQTTYNTEKPQQINSEISDQSLTLHSSPPTSSFTSSNQENLSEESSIDHIPENGSPSQLQLFDIQGHEDLSQQINSQINPSTSNSEGEQHTQFQITEPSLLPQFPVSLTQFDQQNTFTSKNPFQQISQPLENINPPEVSNLHQEFSQSNNQEPENVFYQEYELLKLPNSDHQQLQQSNLPLGVTVSPPKPETQTSIFHSSIFNQQNPSGILDSTQINPQTIIDSELSHSEQLPEHGIDSQLDSTGNQGSETLSQQANQLQSSSLNLNGLPQSDFPIPGPSLVTESQGSHNLETTQQSEVVSPGKLPEQEDIIQFSSFGNQEILRTTSQQTESQFPKLVSGNERLRQVTNIHTTNQLKPQFPNLQLPSTSLHKTSRRRYYQFQKQTPQLTQGPNQPKEFDTQQPSRSLFHSQTQRESTQNEEYSDIQPLPVFNFLKLRPQLQL